MDEMTFEIIRIIISAVFAILGIFIYRVAAPYIDSLTISSDQETVLVLIDAAVRAMEQTFKSSGMGKAKKAEAIAFVRAQLGSAGIDISDEQLDKLIEAAVYSMNMEKKG